MKPKDLLLTLATLGAPPETRNRTSLNAAIFLLMTPLLLLAGLIIAVINGAWLGVATIGVVLVALFAVRFATWKIKTRVSDRAASSGVVSRAASNNRNRRR